MKSILKYSALALLATAMSVSCEKEMAFDDQVAGEKIVRTFTCTFAQPDTKVAVTNEGKTTWEVGDEIMIHGGTDGEARYKVKLTADDISNDGKTATIHFEMDPYDRTDVGVVSKFYAQYPARLVPDGPIYYECRFSGGDDFLMAACDVGDKFVFYNLCGIISFEATGEFDKFELVGNDGEYIGYQGTYQARVRLDEGNEAPIVTNPKFGNGSGDGVPAKSFAAQMKDGVNYVFIPAGTNFTGGFTFKFFDGDELKKVAKTETPVNVAPGKILALGDITSHLEDYVAPSQSDHTPAEWAAGATDLSIGGQAPANCYIVSAPGVYKFPALKGNSDEVAGNIFGAELLWETYNNAETVTANSVIAAVDYDNDYVYFKTPESLKPGNALIAAKNDQDKIMWSWHIWIPASEIKTVATEALCGSPMMDRNLGALVPTLDGAGGVPTVESYGLMYQWGRKDPFLGPKRVDSGSPALVAEGQSAATLGGGAALSYAEAVANPTVFINVSGGDWLSGSAERWAKNKTVNDPCPAGYQIAYGDKGSSPEYPIWNSSDLTGVEGWAYSKDDHWFTFGTGDSMVSFPFAGYYDDNQEGETPGIAHPGDRAAIWFYATNTSSFYHLNLRADSGSFKAGSTSGARGASIRCVKIDGWVEPTPPEPEKPAQVGDVLWSETWTGGEKDATVEAYTQSGTTVYGDATVTYTAVKPDGGSAIKIYIDNQMDGSTVQENLLLSKGGGTWTITGIPTGGAEHALLSIKVNSKRDPVLSTTAEEFVKIGERQVGDEAAKPYTYSWALDFTADATTFDLTFTLNNSSNIRIDDVMLVVTDGAAPEQPKEPAYEHQWGWYSAGDGSTLWTANVTAISVTHPDGYGMVRGLAMDDEYIYLPKSSGYAAIAAVKITDPNTQVKGNVTGVATGDTFQTSFVRVIKNTDANVNGGKDILLLSNLTAANGGPVVIYAYTNGIEAAPVELAKFAWDSANSVEDWRRYGDRFFVTGTWQNGKIYLPSFNPMKMVVLSVANGARTDVIQMAATAEVSPAGIKDVVVWEGTDTQYLLMNNDFANLVVPTGNKQDNGWDELALNFAVDNAKGTWGYNFFTFNEKDYIAYARIVDKKACIEIIEAGVNLGRAISVPKVLMQIPINSAASLDSELTTGGLADCAVRVIDGVPYIAALTRDGAMTVYKLVMK